MPLKEAPFPIRREKSSCGRTSKDAVKGCRSDAAKNRKPKRSKKPKRQPKKSDSTFSK